MRKTLVLLVLIACGTPQVQPPAASDRTALAKDAARLIELASQQMNRGNNGAAVITLEKAIAIDQKLGDASAESVAWSMLGRAHLALGAYEKADAAMERSAALAGTKEAPTTTAVREMIAKLGVASDAGPSSAFLRSFDTSLDLMPDGAMMLDHFWPFLSEIVDVAAGAPSSRERLESGIALMTGRDLFEQGKYAEARTTWTAGLERAAHSDLRSAFEAGIGATYLKEHDEREAIRWFQRAADTSDAQLKNIKSPELMTSYAGSERRWYADITIELLLRNGRAAEAFDYSERSRARALLQMLGNQRLRGEPSDAEYASLTTIQPVPLDALRRELPVQTTMIAYYVSVYGVRAFILDRDALRAMPLPFDRAAFDRTIAWATSFRGRRARGMTTDGVVEPIGSAEEAFALLIAPLQPYLRDARLLIVPHGDLHYVPFAALRNATSGRYLIEDATLTYLPSASTFRFLHAKETPVSGRALVLGNPETGLADLPGGAREATVVAHTFRTVAHLGADATEDRIHRLHGDFDLLHIAAHGLYDPDHPLHSRIALAASAGHDGNLEVREILSSVDLRGVNLVVLSACRTASGKRGGGDDVVGLTRAMLYAGSPAVISTLWDIDDDAAAALMEELYGHLRAGASVADALRRAQLALLHTNAHADPAYWAAFTLTGDSSAQWIW